MPDFNYPPIVQAEYLRVPVALLGLGRYLAWAKESRPLGE